MRRRRRSLLATGLIVGVISACFDSQNGPTSTSTLPSVASSTMPDATTSAQPIVTTTISLSTTAATVPQFDGELIELAFNQGEVLGGGRLPVALGSNVRLVVTADVPDEVHLHGYDLSVPVTPAEPGTIEFVADIPGVFEVELEDSGVKLADLEVSP